MKRKSAKAPPKQYAGKKGKTAGSKGPLVALVSNYIRQSVQNRQLKPGDLIDFVQIGEELGISRTPIRESIGRLQSDGLIESLPGGQFRIAILTESQIQDFYAVRLELELTAAAIAAHQITENEIALLRSNLDIFASSRSDSELLIRIDNQFHEIIFEATRNRYLTHRLKHLRGILGLLPFRTFSNKDRIDAVLHEHRAIADALAARNPDAAAKAVSDHINSAKLARTGVL